MKALSAIVSEWWGVILILLAWQIWVLASGLNSIVMPSPGQVVLNIADAPTLYLTNTAHTAALAVGGLIIGMAIGVAMAGLSWVSPLIAGLLTPIGLVFTTVPVVALIPLLGRLLGYDVGTILAIVALVSFFPTFVFVSSGLRALPPGSADLFRVTGANRLAFLTHLAVPAAIPNFMVALRLAASQAFLAALVAEFLMGNDGLGALVHAAKEGFETERAIGASVIATVLSVLAFLGTTGLEKTMRNRWT
jgi:NitT/TauT family transport system permease protein